ncbi:hypothetical protein, conserved [Cyanidioschyzon merolae strain 10D]|jgi:hypothetical protein|uniref:Complex 1 LYR protein domain-containing protein n=1 Tax=Cyanidioschyzon merolae (strain NIES-3377 / 10D) TaxID=280699 RepID=M1V8P7_CYAM1|nr:hypothetical protein, conserved [Cyanidioschyzon merolae strain 10D]BAM80799.1 hypothetical protein, conserved [Cyanidioschyzon merolae strain 10D]|eukprot:XP_005536835.1 hypothetical protein, conserved [Cyanidioschyzon merolae strain 10D]
MRLLRHEALSLYRESLRTCKAFTWQHPSGKAWREILAETLRKEFEAGRLETQPDRILELLVNGREALRKTQELLVQKQRELQKRQSLSSN